jgi:3-phosphoshikimate 1-carboxyvinyltransferase
MTQLVSHPVASHREGLKGTARVPGDKSISHRALMLGAIAHGVTEVTGLLEGEDVLSTARALMALGVQIHPPASAGGAWRIEGIGQNTLKTPRTALYLGNSGTSARLLMGLMCGYSVTATFMGDDSLSRRPMGRVIKPLAQMGVTFDASSGDKLPLRVYGTPSIRAIEYTLPVASAQVKSAIMLAALRAGGNTVIIEPEPTRDHSERMLRHMGANIGVERKGGTNVITVHGRPTLQAQDFSVPSDPSSAAFLTVAALITPGSDILIPHVSVNPLRTGIYDTLIEMGADITFSQQRDTTGEPTADIRVKYSALKGVDVPPARVPTMIDEFPVLSVAAAFADGTTRMTGLGELRVKESDRLGAMATGLAAAGVNVEAGDDTLTVHGTGHAPEGGCAIAAKLDHRIAMSFLVMGLATRASIAIDDATTINTSFPGFAKLMNDLGASISAT